VLAEMRNPRQAAGRAPGGFAAGAEPSAPVVGSCRFEAFCQRVVSRQEPVGKGNLTPPRHAELLPQDVAMSLRGPRGDPEHETEFLVRQAFGDQLDHFELPRRDR
jgi:hypothetical protein